PDTESGFLSKRPCEATKCGQGGSRRPATGGVRQVTRRASGYGFGPGLCVTRVTGFLPRPPETNGRENALRQSGLLSPHVARRAQAREQVASRIGPIPEKEGAVSGFAPRLPFRPAHAVTSRVTSWAFWFWARLANAWAGSVSSTASLAARGRMP